MSLHNHFSSVIGSYLLDPLHRSISDLMRPSRTALESVSTSSTMQFVVPRKTARSSEQEGSKAGELVGELLIAMGSALVLTFISRWVVERYFGHQSQLQDPDQPAAKTVYKGLARILKKRGGASATTGVPPLDSYELQMATVILDPDEIETSFGQVGGLDETKKEIYELAVLPLVHPELFVGKLVQPCKGILLYGKPGTGKTMMAKALAKEAEAVFIPLQLSKILNKWVGESNKLIAAAFSLAHKLQPAVIFIDEVDTFLKANSGEAAQYLDTIKSEFLILWDGVATASESRVMVLGATNKPQSIDPAIQRRMPRTFHVPLPDQAGRQNILEILLGDEQLTPEAKASIPKLAKVTNNYSGSDLKEMCKAAAMMGIQERTAEYSRLRVSGKAAQADRSIGRTPMRAISRDDLVNALRKVRPTGAAASEYGRREARDQTSASMPSLDENSVRSFLELIRGMSAASVEEEEASEGDDFADAIPERN